RGGRKFGEPSGIGLQIITCKYYQDWLKNCLLRFQETRSFLEAWQPFSKKVILVSVCLGLLQ
ncbi:hypothetical protein V4Y02_23520, partial [Escherichia coli]